MRRSQIRAIPSPPRLTGLLLAFFLAFWATPSFAADLTVTVGGLRNFRGSVWIYLWNDVDMDRFPDPSRVQRRDEQNGAEACGFPSVSLCRRGITSLQDLIVSYTFHDLPEGDYAIAVLHDENNDGILDTGFLHRPLEGRGFSGVLPQDVHSFSRIIYARAAFHFDKTQAMTIGLRYPSHIH